jgi:hypothetical protein
MRGMSIFYVRHMRSTSDFPLFAVGYAHVAYSNEVIGDNMLIPCRKMGCVLHDGLLS